MKKSERWTLKELENYCELLNATEANCLKGGLAAVSKAEFETAMNNGDMGWRSGRRNGICCRNC